MSEYMADMADRAAAVPNHRTPAACAGALASDVAARAAFASGAARAAALALALVAAVFRTRPRPSAVAVLRR
jgi:hypothetical protein